jgi:hypothetical protein
MSESSDEDEFEENTTQNETKAHGGRPPILQLAEQLAKQKE